MRYTTIILLLFFNTSFAQNAIEVYRNGILGQYYNEKGNYDSAEKYLLKALYLMKDKSRFGPYFQLIKFAWKNKDEQKISEYLTALSCIYPKDTIQGYLKEWAEADMDNATFNRLYKPKCILTENRKAAPHSKAVDSIVAAIIEGDQAVRKKVNILNKKTNKTEEEMVALEKEMHQVDSTDFEVLYSCIKKYGFPDIDYPLNYSRVTLLIHTDNYDNFKKLDKYLLKAVREGHRSPAVYAYSLDRSLAFSKMKPKYYWLIPGSFDEYKPTKEEITRVNSERRKIGLPPYPMWTGWGF